MSEHKYAVGNKVIATRDIWQESSDDHPESMYAKCGDILEVRKISGRFWHVYVAHPERKPGEMFGVRLHEIKAANAAGGE